MVDFNYKRVITIKEMAFGIIEDCVQKKCDVVYMHSNEADIRTNRISKKGIAQEQYTLENNLTLEEDKIFASFNKNYKYEIRRAPKEGTKCQVIDLSTKDVDRWIDEFEIVYNKMFDAKGMSNRFNRALVTAGINAENIIITKAYVEGKDCIVYHAYLVDGERTVLMYSASTLADSDGKEIANLIGWMNKYLHWYDMLWFKERAYLVYEWGGIDSVDNPGGIAKFKMGFGGEIKMYINYLVANSLLGIVYVQLVKMRGSEWK